MKMRKNKLDEMQEQKLLQIEHNAAWLAFWGLLVAMVVQLFLYGFEGGKHIIGEWVVFMCLALYLVVGCLRIGVWDRKLEANVKTNLIASLIAGMVTGVLFAAINYRSYRMIEGAVANFVINGVMVFVACFVGLSFAAHLYKKKVEKLEKEEE
ncbi:MAG: hypothetical protein PUD93_09545 [Lachnospiraceae bacterium]|nr:hypothetical protein [Lachnospiraceae bacterium]